MGFFSDLFGFDSGPKETTDEIKSRIENAEASKVFLEHFVTRFSPDGDLYKYLIADTRDRSIFIKVVKQGVSIQYMNFSRSFYKANNTYTVDSEGIGFGASGYADLPNSSYVYEFERFLLSNLESLCPHLKISNSGSEIVVHLKETAKVGW